MSTQVSTSVTITATSNGVTAKFSAQKSTTATGNIVYSGVQSIATSATALTFGNVSGTPLKVAVQNLDPTNYVEVDSANTFDKFPQKLLAGDPIVLSPQTGTIYAKANTAACLVQVVAMSA